MDSTHQLSSFDKLLANQNSSLGWTIFLINHPDPKDQHPIHLSHLKQAARYLTQSEYAQEILLERNLNGLCGYPVCSNQPVDNADSDQRNKKLNSKKIRSIHHKLNAFNQEHEPKFCSQICQARSDYYLNSVLKKLSSSSSILPSNNKKHINDQHEAHLTDDQDEILLLEELNQEQLVDTPNNAEQLPMIQFENSGSSSQQQEYSHEFLQPFLTQLESDLQLKNKRIDQNLNPIFSSIKIIEHPPKLSTSSDPLQSSDHLNEIEHQFLNHFPKLQISSPSRRDINGKSDYQPNQNSVLELSSSLTQTLSSQVILSNSNPGAYQKRKLANGNNPQLTPLSVPSDDVNASSTSIEPSDLGTLEAQIVYNVGSVEDQLAIDQAIALRDQLYPKSSDP